VRLTGCRDRSWFGLFASKGLPPEIVTRLSDETDKVAAQPDIRQKLLAVAQYAQHQSATEFGQQVARDKSFFAALLKELDIRLE
jgi:tripartite-type tricarboxylate transporter receptor subunit TctC